MQPSCKSSEKLCFYCDEKGGTDSLHEVATLQVDQRVQKSAKLIGTVLSWLNWALGDMVALEAKYHTKCLLALHNSARKVQVVQ